MSTLTLELERELDALDAEDALHIQRAVREMLHLARSKEPVVATDAPNPGMFTLPSWNLGVRSGLDLTRLAHVDEDDTSA